MECRGQEVSYVEKQVLVSDQIFPLLKFLKMFVILKKQMADAQ